MGEAKSRREGGDSEKTRMKSCPYCSAQTNPDDATYCSYCGSSLSGGKGSSSIPSAPDVPDPNSYSTPGVSERYDRAFRRTEQLSLVIAILSIITLALLIV